MSVFQVKSYRKTVEVSIPLTAGTAESTELPTSDGFSGEGVELCAGFFPEPLTTSAPSTPEEKTPGVPTPPTAETAVSICQPPSNGSNGEGSRAYPEKPPLNPATVQPSATESDWPDPFTIGQQVGYCGSCRHWTRDGTDYLGLCALGWAAHGLPHQPGVVLITVHARCMARDGTAWKART